MKGIQMMGLLVVNSGLNFAASATMRLVTVEGGGLLLVFAGRSRRRGPVADQALPRAG